MCLRKHYSEKEERLMSNKEKTIALYKETIEAYLGYIKNKNNDTYNNLIKSLDNAEKWKQQLVAEQDENSLIYLHMWYIDGEGWKNLEPVDEQVKVAITACEKALDNKDETTEFMNLDVQYINPNLTVIDKDNVDEFVESMEEAKDALEEEIEKIEKEDDMRTEETTKSKGDKMKKLKKIGKYALGGALVLGGIAAAAYAYKKYQDDGIIVIDFSK